MSTARDAKGTSKGRLSTYPQKNVLRAWAKHDLNFGARYPLLLSLSSNGISERYRMYLPPDDPEAGPADEPIDPPEDHDNPRADSDGTTADGTSHRELSTDKTLRASSSSARTIEAQWTERGHENSAQRGSQPNRGRRRTAEAPAEEEIEEFEDAPTFEDDDDRGAHLVDHTDRGRYSPITEVIHFNRKRRRRGGALTPLPTPRTSMLTIARRLQEMHGFPIAAQATLLTSKPFLARAARRNGGPASSRTKRKAVTESAGQTRKKAMSTSAKKKLPGPHKASGAQKGKGKARKDGIGRGGAARLQAVSKNTKQGSSTHPKKSTRGQDSASRAQEATETFDPEQEVWLYTTLVDNETCTSVANTLGCPVESLVQANRSRYPGLTAKARLRKGTTLVYEDDDCTTEPPGNPEHAPEVSAVQHDKTPRDDRAPSKHTESSGSKATTHSKDPQLAGTASGPPATSAVSPSRVPLLRPKPAPATSAFKPFYCGTASIIEE